MGNDWVYFCFHASALSDEYRTNMYDYAIECNSIGEWFDFTATYMGISV